MHDCKLRCIDDSGGNHIRNNIYRVINGKLECKNSNFTTSIYNSIEEINDRRLSQFELYEEESIKEKFINMAKEEILVFESCYGNLGIILGDKILYKENTYVYLENLDDNLERGNYFIKKIYKNESVHFDDLFDKNHLEEIWERELPTVEVSIEEIARLKGIKPEQIRIKKDDE